MACVINDVRAVASCVGRLKAIRNTHISMLFTVYVMSS